MLAQHSLTHFPISPGARSASNLEDVIRRIENSRDQFDYGYMGDEGPLQIACFLVGPDTSSGAIHATMVPDSKKMDMPYVATATAKRVRALGHESFCTHGDKEGVLQLPLDEVARECRPEWTRLANSTTSVTDTRAIRAMEPRRKPSPQCVDLLEHI